MEVLVNIVFILVFCVLVKQSVLLVVGGLIEDISLRLLVIMSILERPLPIMTINLVLVCQGTTHPERTVFLAYYLVLPVLI